MWMEVNFSLFQMKSIIDKIYGFTVLKMWPKFTQVNSLFSVFRPFFTTVILQRLQILSSHERPEVVLQGICLYIQGSPITFCTVCGTLSVQALPT